MNFAAGQHLFWLLLLPLLWWLATPPPPRAVAWTPYLAQVRLALARWQRAPRQRHWLRRLLLVLAAGCAVLASADLGYGEVPPPQRLAILLDGSHSMQARDAGGPSRWEQALACAATELANVPSHVEVSLVRCGASVLRRSGPFARALADLGAPSGAGVDLAAIAEAVGAQAVVWTITDGQGMVLLPNGPRTVVGKPCDNASIVAAILADGWPLPALAVELTLQNCGEAAHDYQLELSGDAIAPVTLHGQLAAHEQRRERIALARQPRGGALRAMLLQAADVLAADGQVQWQLPPLPAPTIAVLQDAESGPFARAAAQALADEVAGTVVGGEALAAGLLLVDGGMLDFAPGNGRALVFGASLQATPRGTPWLAPRLLDWDRTGPLLAGLDLSELRIELAWPAVLPPGTPLLFGAGDDGTARPLAVLCGGAEQQSLHFAFRLADSNLPLLPAFPQLLRRAFVAAYGQAAQARLVVAPAPASELNLRQVAPGGSLPLPPFLPERSSWAGSLWGLALLAMLLRAVLR